MPGELQLRMRLNEAGRRTSELTSDSQRFVAGLSGTAGGWDYDLGYNHSVNTVKDKDTHGYVLYNELLEGIANGLINPFGPSGAVAWPCSTASRSMTWCSAAPWIRSTSRPRVRSPRSTAAIWVSRSAAKSGANARASIRPRCS
ncbi:hypothetical protein LP420_39665 [Massilia sp. B-10]|nr:hypothetical protein LP420_39665 [Massilia sp. B-10]